MKAYDGTFIHGIDLKNWYPVHNISLAGSLMSPDYLALIDSGIGASHLSLREASLSDISNAKIPSGAVTPRSVQTIIMASIIKSTGGVGFGLTNTQSLMTSEMQEVLLKANVELEFERLRRIVASDAASRLSCIWVAENNRIGEAHIRKMLGVSTYIVSVDIPEALRVTKVDTDWFDLYCHDPKEEYIHKYWSSLECTSIPKWEFLVEGIVRLTEERQIDYIKKFGAKIP
ncbi:hypothetical protein [Anaeroselena agilis]|uniref:Peptidase A2 domain-containing protein n=1 Tax=Anaeroselena agilis TaxID=3063788 RepID=A0ABU3P4P3_9FIRM|nr:hypothetical protein [Selenomonadales bacterium 4137-cl]